MQGIFPFGCHNSEEFQDCIILCACVRACVRVCVRACVCACIRVSPSLVAIRCPSAAPEANPRKPNAKWSKCLMTAEVLRWVF